MSKQTDFNSAYWASKPPQVQALQYFPVEEDGTAALQIQMPPITSVDVIATVDQLRAQFAKVDHSVVTRLDVAYGLATQGAVLDAMIDIQGWDPFTTMTVRQAYGYTWVPSALQAGVSVAPGLNEPGQVPYDPNNPPAGSIKVTLNLADYPQFDPPKAAVAPPASGVSPVGIFLHDTMYAQQPWDKTNDGDITGQGGVPSDARGRFQKHKVASAFGFQAWFTKI